MTAGVYVLFRFDSLLLYLSLGNIIIILGGLTILMARIRAFLEIDIKKIVALSTLRQLGVIITALGAGFGVLRFFHLLTHAFFKALLFISAGNLIHRVGGYQDLRAIGGISETIPLSQGVTLGSLISLCGLPFISAFYSKENIIDRLLLSNFSFMAYFTILLGILMTIFYSVRFIVLATWGTIRECPLSDKSDIDLPINLRIILLLPPAVSGGRLISSFLKLGPLYVVRGQLKLTILILLMGGLFIFFKFYRMGPLTSRQMM